MPDTTFFEMMAHESRRAMVEHMTNGMREILKHEPDENIASLAFAAKMVDRDRMVDQGDTGQVACAMKYATMASILALALAQERANSPEPGPSRA